MLNPIIPLLFPSLLLTHNVDYSPTRSDTYLRPGAPNLMTPVGKTSHPGGTGGGFDFPPPGFLCCPESVGGKSGPVGLSVRTLTHDIPPHSTSNGE